MDGQVVYLPALVGPLPDLPGAACAQADPEAWFPDPGGSTEAAQAKRICAACPERRPCLAWALNTGEAHGIWGGLTPEERRRLARRIRRASTTNTDTEAA